MSILKYEMCCCCCCCCCCTWPLEAPRLCLQRVLIVSKTGIGSVRRAREMVILGTQYAGEMKKGIFTVMHYFMPKRGILSLHSGCNVGAANDVSLFFGLSGASMITPIAEHATGRVCRV